MKKILALVICALFSTQAYSMHYFRDKRKAVKTILAPYNNPHDRRVIAIRTGLLSAGAYALYKWDESQRISKPAEFTLKDVRKQQGKYTASAHYNGKPVGTEYTCVTWHPYSSTLLTCYASIHHCCADKTWVRTIKGDEQAALLAELKACHKAESNAPTQYIGELPALEK